MAAGSSAATAAAAAATVAANAARKKACEASVKGYEHNTAKVEEARSYADCIRRLHPSTLSPDAVIGIKVAIVIVLACTLVGIVRGFRDTTWSRGEGMLMGALAWGVGSAALLSVCLMVFLGLRFLAS